jgi:hypothetical protein
VIQGSSYNIFKEMSICLYTLHQIRGYRQAVLLLLCCLRPWDELSDTCLLPKCVVRISYAYFIGLVVSQQNSSCLHFRVQHVYVGTSSHVPYCRNLSMAQCRVQCGHPAISEVMYLLLGKIVQAVLFECWLEQHFFTLMLTTSSTKDLTNVAWT